MSVRQWVSVKSRISKGSLKRKEQAPETPERWVRACLHTSVGWCPRACSGRIGWLWGEGKPFLWGT